jgi:hypothetical protein
MGNERHHSAAHRYSDTLANGAFDDDKDLVDINDFGDEQVDENVGLVENNMVQLNENEGRYGKGYNNHGDNWNQIMAQVDN